MSAVIDHIIPIDRGGSPDDIDNLQLTHMACNRAKADNLMEPQKDGKANDKASRVITNRNLPQSRDWAAYAPDGKQKAK